MSSFKNGMHIIYKNKDDCSNSKAFCERLEAMVDGHRYNEFKLEIFYIKNTIQFELSKRIGMVANPFNPIFYGTIEEQSDNLKISGRFGVHSYTSVLSFAFFVFIVFHIFFTFFLSGFNSVETTINYGGMARKIYVPWWVSTARNIGILLLFTTIQVLGKKFQEYKHSEILNLLKKL